MRFHTRKWIKPEDLNANGRLFGGRLLSWITEEAALYSIIQLEDQNCVMKYMSEINFINPVSQGGIIEIGIEVISFGTTSITLKSEVRNKLTREAIATVDQLIFVVLDAEGKPKVHGKTKVEYVKDRLESES
ncbi:acyl-CoA thioesterase [Robiginitalea aurantiaca]|uniref:Hotdog domain-containing protein n=1 Tax=Robiginitalea aurantiaca TaxID=3056915 RepID=A0ABT7WFS2_9FLAO|nr:hotdog domain-containing protein [Robiginitalea aurantiaca]MDM9631771.1 hotdog domain-containing protein [Robiginitalea aurantiaca]